MSRDIKACSVVAYHFSLSYHLRRLSVAIQLFISGFDSFSALTSSSFPSLTDFSAAAIADALKWTDLDQNIVYQIVSTRTVSMVNQSFCLSRRMVDLALVYGIVVC